MTATSRPAEDLGYATQFTARLQLQGVTRKQAADIVRRIQEQLDAEFHRIVCVEVGPCGIKHAAPNTADGSRAAVNAAGQKILTHVHGSDFGVEEYDVDPRPGRDFCAR